MNKGLNTKDEVVELGEWIKQHRLQQGLSLEDLGEMVGLSDSQLSRLERGISEVTLLPAVKLFRELGIDVVEFVEHIGLSKSVMQNILTRRESSQKHFPHALRLVDAWCAASLYRNMPERKSFLKELAGWYLQLTGMAMVPYPTPKTKEMPPEARAYEVLHTVFEKEHFKTPLPYFETLSRDEVVELYWSGSAMLIPDGGFYLRQWRLDHGVRLKKIASEAGLSLSKYYDIERDRTQNLKLHAIIQIQRALPSEPIFPLFWAAAATRAGIDDTFPIDPEPLPWDDRTWLMADALIKISRLAYGAGTPTAVAWASFIRKRCQEALNYIEQRYGKATARAFERCYDLEQFESEKQGK